MICLADGKDDRVYIYNNSKEHPIPTIFVFLVLSHFDGYAGATWTAKSNVFRIATGFVVRL